MSENAPARVLSVGQCSADDFGIRSIIERNFDARVETVDGVGEALNLIRTQQFDLVLVNRIMFNDGQAGMDLIRIAKSEELSTPVMMVSNYPESQSEAVAAGAMPGFGKANLHSDQTREHLMKFLPVRNVAAT